MANNTNWLNISSQSGSSGQTILTLSANKNLSTNYKTAEITAYNPVYNISAKTYVTLEVYSPILSISPDLFGVPDSGGTYELTITANCAWVIAFPDLVTSYSTTAGTGNAVVTFTVPGTTADTTLAGNIVVTDESGQVSRTARVEQYGSGVHIGIFPVELYFDSTGGSKTFSVTADAAYNVSVGSGTDWAFVEPHSGYTGQTTFTVTVNSENTGTTDKQGVINIDAPGQDLAVILYQRKPETRLVATYYVTSTTDPTRILRSTASFSAAEYPDGTQITLGTGYTFPTTGYQTVYYTLTESTVGGFQNSEALTSVVIPKGVTVIANNTFSSCSGLTSVTIPNTVTQLGAGSFNQCTSLSSITLPDSLQTIAGSAFNKCTSLSSITVPSTVTKIGTNCFSGSSVSSITFTSLTPPTLGNTNALTSSTLSEIIVPCPAVNDYITAWPQYAQYISCQDTGTTLYFVTDTSNVKGIGETRTITILNTNINPNRTGLNLPSDFPQQGSYTVVGNTIYLTYPRNPSSSATRSWTIGVVAQTKDGVSLSGSYHITQNANVTYSIPYTADTSTVNKTGETRTITIDASNLVASSITIGIEGATGITYSYNNGVVTVIFPPNIGYDKTITITISGETLNGNAASASVTYTQESGKETRVVATYNVTSTSSATKILSGRSAILKAELEDGTVIPLQTGYTFSESGNQKVYYTVKDNYLGMLPGGSGSIDAYASFKGITALTAVYIPGNIVGIGEKCFSGTPNLQTVVLEEGLIRIGTAAFGASSSLTSLVIPNSVERIGSACCNYDTSLTGVSLGAGLTGIPDSCFYHCDSLTSLTIPENITNIGNRAFAYSALHSLIIPDGVSSIGNNCFSNCTNLSAVTLPSGLTQLSAYCFYNCTNLITITIPQTMTTVDAGVFSGCSGMESMTFEGITPPSLSGSTNSLGSTAYTFPIYVPCQSINAYKASFSSYANRISCPEAHLNYTADTSAVAESGETRYIYLNPAEIDMESFNLNQLGPVEVEYSCNTVTGVVEIIFPSNPGPGTYYNFHLTATTVNGVEASADVYYLQLYPIANKDKKIAITYYVESTTEPTKILGDKPIASPPLPGPWTYFSTGELENGQVFYLDTGSSIVSATGVTTGYTFPVTGECTVFYTYIYPNVFPWGCFAGAKVIRAVINEGVVSLSTDCFMDCTGLTSVTLPNSLQKIGSDCFMDCVSLSGIVLNEGLKDICDYAFYNCSSISSITIPSTFNGIGYFAFSKCSSLQGFYGSFSSSDNRLLISNGSIKDLKGGSWDGEYIPANTALFFAPAGLTNYNLPSGILSTYVGSFEECVNLTSIGFPETLQTIGASSFARCSSLTQLVFPSGVTRLELSSFSGCSSLSSITAHPIIAPYIGTSYTTNTFYRVKENGTLYYPNGSDYSSWLTTTSGNLGYYGWTGQTF